MLTMKKGFVRFRDLQGKYYQSVITGLQVAVDLAVLSGAFLVGYYVYTHIIPIGYEPRFFLYKKLVLFSSIVGLVIFERFGLYRSQMSLLNIDEIRRSFRAVMILALIIFAYNFYSKSDFSRLILTYSLFILLLAVITERMIFFKIRQYLHLKGFHIHNVLIYGSGKVGQQLFKKIHRFPKLGYRAIGFVDESPSEGSPMDNRAEVLGTPADLGDLVKRYNIQELLIARPSIPPDALLSAIEQCEVNDIDYSFVPNIFGFFIESVRLKEIDGIPLITTRRLRLSRMNRTIKRTFDIGLSSLVLLLTWPLMLTIALIVKLSSRGPAIFRQVRVGRGGKLFTIFKFRTMYQDTPQYAPCPNGFDDPRITRVGRFLRLIFLDELPQLWNVFVGDMSIVGPRPEMAFIVADYDDLQRERLNSRPGITGLWQISKDRGADIHENMEYDVYYLENQSLLLDLAIIVLTIMFAFLTLIRSASGRKKAKKKPGAQAPGFDVVSY